MFGTRPEAIKLAPLASQLNNVGNEKVEIITINTGQHQDLMPSIMEIFGVRVTENLSVLSKGKSLSHLATTLSKELEDCYRRYQPDVAIVQGDTITAAMAAMTAILLNIPVAHVEAGLRTYNPNSPFPEEYLRRTISAGSHWHFAPTSSAANNLHREHTTGKIFVTGNTVVDALETILRQVVPAPKRPGFRRIVATMHRRENRDFYDDILHALGELSDIDGVEVLLPVHTNPSVQKAVQSFSQRSKITVVKPMDYIPWISLLLSADLLISDSGGLQEEAPLLGLPLLITRQETERPEVLWGNHAKLVGHDPALIVKTALSILTGSITFSSGTPFGDGCASRRIADILISELTSCDSVNREA